MRIASQSLAPTLAEVIQTVIDANLIELHVCLPGKVETYDYTTQYADILPSLYRGVENGNQAPTLQAWPVIPNVPVIWPRASSGEAFIHLPLLPGDDVTLIISERSLDNWKQTGMLSSPDDRRKFNITDAMCIPGGSGKALAFTPQASDDLEIQNGESAISLGVGGDIDIGLDATHPAALGDAVQARLSAIESALSALIGVFNSHTHAVTTAPGVTGPPTPTDSPFTPAPNIVSSETVSVTS